MKKVVLLATHLNSGSSELLYQLAVNPRIQSYRTNNLYDHPTALENVENKPHKCGHNGAVYVDEILYNHSIRCPRILDICRFIYLVREPRQTLEGMVGKKMLTPLSAVRYYCFRLRRLCEMARKTPGAILLTHEDLANGKGLPLLEDYLHLDTPLQNIPGGYALKDCRELIPKTEMDTAERAYEKYLYFLRNTGLRLVR
jgi:hypothetical protein